MEDESKHQDVDERYKGQVSLLEQEREKFIAQRRQEQLAQRADELQAEQEQFEQGQIQQTAKAEIDNIRLELNQNAQKFLNTHNVVNPENRNFESGRAEMFKLEAQNSQETGYNFNNPKEMKDAFRTRQTRDGRPLSQLFFEDYARWQEIKATIKDHILKQAPARLRLNEGLKLVKDIDDRKLQVLRGHQKSIQDQTKEEAFSTPIDELIEQTENNPTLREYVDTLQRLEAERLDIIESYNQLDRKNEEAIQVITQEFEDFKKAIAKYRTQLDYKFRKELEHLDFLDALRRRQRTYQPIRGQKVLYNRETKQLDAIQIRERAELAKEKKQLKDTATERVARHKRILRDEIARLQNEPQLDEEAIEDIEAQINLNRDALATELTKKKSPVNKWMEELIRRKDTLQKEINQLIKDENEIKDRQPNLYRETLEKINIYKQRLKTSEREAILPPNPDEFFGEDYPIYLVIKTLANKRIELRDVGIEDKAFNKRLNDYYLLEAIHQLEDNGEIEPDQGIKYDIETINTRSPSINNVIYETADKNTNIFTLSYAIVEKISNGVGPFNSGINIQFYRAPTEDTEAEFITRTFRAVTFPEVLANIRLFNGELQGVNEYNIHGSDVVGGQASSYKLLTNIFSIRFPKTIIVGTKPKLRVDLMPKNGKFKILDVNSKAGDCLLEVIRYLWKQTNTKIVVSEANEAMMTIPTIAQLRKHLKVKSKGAIPVTYCQQLAELANLTIRTYSMPEDGNEKPILTAIYSANPDMNRIIDIMIHRAPEMDEEHAYALEIERESAKSSAPAFNPKTKYIKRCVVVDFETIICLKRDSKLKSYGGCWYEFDIDNPPKDFADEIERVESCTGEAIGLAELEFLKYVLSQPSNVKLTIVGYNSARFDNFLIAKAGASHGCLSQAFIARGELKKLMLGRHDTLDLCKILATSLKSACESFNTSPKKMDGYSHIIPQNIFNDGGEKALMEWVNLNKTFCEEYNKLDVLATADLLIKTRKAILEITGVDFMEGKLIQTAGSIAERAIYRVWGEENQTLPEACTEARHDKFIREAVTGGRVQNFKGQPFKLKDGRLYRMVDVTSLYPSVMVGINSHMFSEKYHYGSFPIGQCIETPTYVKGKIGFYSVKISNQPQIKIIPLREKGKPLDWDYQHDILAKVSSSEIELLRDKGAVVEVYEGIYWEESTKSMFTSFINPICDMKNLQDSYDKAGDSRFNPALRGCCKLLMNSCSGKFLQKNYDDVTELIRNPKEREIALEKINPEYPIYYTQLTPSAEIINGKKKEEHIYNPKTSKPSQISALIYVYARLYMYETALKYNPIYMDTDSCLMLDEDYQRFIKDFPHLDPVGQKRRKGLGDFEEELGAQDSTTGYIIQPKLYYVKPSLKGVVNKKKIKNKVKGVNMRSDKLITDSNLPNEFTTMDEEAKFNFYNSDNSQSINLSDDAERLFKQLYETGQVSVLSSQLERNPKTMEMKQRYIIKTMRIEK